MFRSLVLTLLLSSAANADNWPAWRGPGNQGISTETKLPLQWSRSQNVRWKTPVAGNGVSQPVVWEDRIFLTGSDGRLNEKLHIYCYARSDGRQLWHTRLFGSAPTDLYAPGGMAVPTPATDGRYLYVLFGSGDLAALDFDGRPVWIRSLAQEYGPFRNRWGMSSSPILYKDMLLVQVDHTGNSYLLAVTAKTGVNRWKTDKPDTGVNWTSPLVVPVNKGFQIVTFGTHFARGYDPEQGTELWQRNGMSSQCICSPVQEGSTLVACSSDGTFALEMDGTTGTLPASKVLWTNKKVGTFITSPLLYGGHVYVASDKGFVNCLSAKTGISAWKERLGDQYHASPVAGADRVYFAAKEGVVHVVAAGAKFEVLAENDIGEGLVASPALSNGQIFLRGEKHLYCIEEK